ncbi:MAG: thioredoxin-disulfide reductase [bacterium]|nr:thioredoxin-disulfide reductase [bacterium]
MYDTIIIGTGPAGFTAGIYAARREMKTLIIGKEMGGQLIWASEIENYPGFKSISSFDLINKMNEQVKALGVEIKSDEVKKIENKDNKFVLHTSRDIYEARTVILAMGLSPRRLAIPGEEKLTGKGVSYCANCDGPFYKNKTVAVVGGGNSALDAAEILSKIAKKVYLIHRRDEFRGFESLVNEIKARKNIELVLNSEPREVIGENKLEKIKIFNNKTRKEKDLEIDGLFVEIGRIANTDLVADLVKRNERGEIIADEKCMTNCPGMFAAGDVTPVEFKQITIACGQGTIAALAAYQYLRLKQGESGEVVDRSYMKK